MRRSLPLAFAAIPLLAGCSDRPEDGLIAVIVGSVLGILVAVLCGMAFYSGTIAAGAINIRLNLKNPTVKSRRWGFVWGVLNLLNGVVGIWLIGLMASNPDPESADASSWLITVAGTLAAFAIGGGAVYAAVRASPGRPTSS